MTATEQMSHSLARCTHYYVRMTEACRLLQKTGAETFRKAPSAGKQSHRPMHTFQSAIESLHPIGVKATTQCTGRLHSHTTIFGFYA